MIKNLLSRTLFVLVLSVFSLSVSAASQAGKTAIKAGNILHCFDWKFTDIQAELDGIQAAGFNTVQTSVAQSNYGGAQDWNAIYRPWDTQIGNGLGTQAQLTALCAAAHARNMYIIVDVVANHTDGDGQSGTPYGGVADFWKGSIYHCNVGGANDGSRYQVTHGHIGMPDLQTENPAVQQKFATYVQLLKSCGVDGIRWDAAKHIGLPSEGDNFWTAVLDNDMYNYGEILNTTGGDHNACINEYQSCGLAVTDNNYSTGMCLGSFKGGNVPSGSESWRGGSTHKDMFVYWGESHDTYLNDGDASQGVNQNVIDRAYAIAAAHEGIPGLYLSRPAVPAKVGVKGSTHYTSNEVAEVNKMKINCAGQSEYYVNSNGVGALLRQTGAVIVKGSGSGQISINNGGGTLAPGQYEDHVSGGMFTVTSSTISGSIGQSGIAVLYSGGSTPMPRATITPNGGTFTTETLAVTVTGSNCTSVWYRIGTATAQTVQGATATFTIGAGAAFGSQISVSYGCSDAEGNQSAIATVTFTKKDPSAVSKIYLKNAANWSAAYIYVYNESASTSNYAWPGVQMASVGGNSCYDFEYELPEQFENGCQVIFAESQTSSNRYPADRQPGLVYSGGDMLFNNSGNSWSNYDPSNCGSGSGGGGTVTPDPDPEPQPGTGWVVYFDNSASNWSSIYYYVWDASSNNKTGWPGDQVTETTSTGLYRIVCDNASYVNIIFNNGGSDQTSNLTVVNGHVYTKDGDSGKSLSEYSQGGGTSGGGSGSQTSGDLCIKSDTEIAVWFRLPAGWALDAVNIFGWGNDCQEFGSHPGKPMTKVGDGLFKYTFSGTVPPSMVQFNNTNTNPWYQMQADFTNHGVYSAESATTNAATLSETVTTYCAGNVPTEVESVVSAATSCRAEKILVDGCLYIRLADHLYDAFGRMVR